MALNTELSLRLDASALIEAFLGQIGGSAAGFTAISAPADADRLNAAAGAGAAFLPAPILDAVRRFAATALPASDVPATLLRIETTLSSIERLTTRDLGADLSTLFEQLTAELERAQPQGSVGSLLRVAELLQRSPSWSALAPLLATLLPRSSGVAAPEALGEYLPAAASTLRVISGLMAYETVLAEGERLTGIVASLFDAEQARRAAEGLAASLRVGAQPLAQLLAAADPNDAARVDALIAATENAAAQLEALDAYVSEGMGFGEATLVHFDVAAAQAQIASAGALLRDPDLGGLRRVIEALARQAAPIAAVLDPRSATARGMEGLLQLAEAQVAQAAAAIRGIDAGVLVSPLTDGLSAITAPLRDFTSLMAQIVLEVRAVLEQVRGAVAALPIDDLASAIRSALTPVTQALQLVTALVDEIREALELAAQSALQALAVVEGEVDQFKQQLTDLFGEARAFVDGLHLDQVVASISDRVNELVGLLEQAQLAPYFDTAASAIGSAADVISQVPLDLLPDSMKADLDAALAPVREVDPEAVQAKIEELLQIGPGGELALRGDLEAALAGVQAKLGELLATLDQHHPQKYLEQIDRELVSIASKIQALTPQLTLEPVTQAIQSLESALGSFDLARELEPVQAVFDDAIGLLDQYSPAALLRPLEARVSEARRQVKTAIRIDDWRPALDDVSAKALAGLGLLDTSGLEALLRTLLGKLERELDELPDVGFGSWLGIIVTGLLDGSGSGLRVGASSIGAVLRWIGGEVSASAELSLRATRISDALDTARGQVERFDLGSLASSVTQADAVREAGAGLVLQLAAGSERRIRLDAALGRLEIATLLGRLSSNRARYLELLGTASALADTLRRTGMSEADVAVVQLRAPFLPLQPLLQRVRQLLSYLGVGGSEQGLASVLRALFAVAAPERITGLIIPLIAALRDRLQTLLDEVLGPVRTAIDSLAQLIDLIDLAPVIDDIDGVFQELRAQLIAYSPAVLLQDQLAAFAGLRQTLLDFDPLAALLGLLDGLREGAARIVLKLSARSLLESPLSIYDTILDAIRPLNIETLLSPVLDVLDGIAQQVDQGLDETVDAFKRLQEALPPPGGGSSASVSVGVT
jgi:hypothetical protein